MAGIAVDQTACIRCGACIDVCLIANVYEMHNDSVRAVRPEACWRCGQCVAACPTDAIDHDDFPLEDCPMYDPAARAPLEQLVPQFRSRRSNRTFDDQSVSRDVVEELLDAGRWAPSATNSQALDWIALDDRTRIAKLAKSSVDRIRRWARLARHPLIRPLLPFVLGREKARAAREASPGAERLYERWAIGQDPIFYNAPVVLIAHARRSNAFARDDAVYAAGNVMLAAESRGLATCQIGLFQMVLERSSRLRRRIGIPEGRAPEVVLILGHPRIVFRRLVPRRKPSIEWNPR